MKHRWNLILFMTITGITLISAGLYGYVSYSRTGTASPADLGISRFVTPTPFFMHEVLTDTTYHSDNGRVKLIAFILINCPDGACPMTMYDFADIRNGLRNAGVYGEQAELVAITIDPENDDSEFLRSYARAFDADPEGWRMLRSTDGSLQNLAGEIGYAFQVHPDGTGFHATTMYLLDHEHQIRAVHRMASATNQSDTERITAQMLHLASDATD